MLKGLPKKHGVSFPEAITALGDPLSMSTPDPDAEGTNVVLLNPDEIDIARLVEGYAPRFCSSQIAVFPNTPPEEP